MSLLKFSSVSYMKTRWELEIFLKIQYHRPPSYSLSANLILLVRVIFWETKKTIGYLTFWHEVKNLYLIIVKMLLLRMCLLFPWTNICWINQFFFFHSKIFLQCCIPHYISGVLVASIVGCLGNNVHMKPWRLFLSIYYISNLWEIPVYFIWHITLQFQPANTVIKSSVTLDIWYLSHQNQLIFLNTCEK